MGEFYVYEHWRTDKGLPFYVGKGSGKRAQDMVLRGKRHKNLRKRLSLKGFEVEVRIVFPRLSEDEAFTLERSLISYWRSRNVKLLNLTDGGDGTKGYRWTTTQRLLSSFAAKARWGKEEYRANVVNAVTAAMRRPDVVAKCITTPDRAARLGAASKASWAVPENRAKRLAVFDRPGHREKISKATKEGMAATGRYPKLPKQRLSPEERAIVNRKRAEKLRALYKDPTLREKVGAAVRTARASKEARVRMSEATRLAYSRPEVKLRHRAAVKAWWARRKEKTHAP